MADKTSSPPDLHFFLTLSITLLLISWIFFVNDHVKKQTLSKTITWRFSDPHLADK